MKPPYLRRCAAKSRTYDLVSCPVCTRNVTSRGVRYQCYSCAGWVHSKCSDLKDARQYNMTKDWACKTCSSAPAPPPTQPLPAPTTASKPKDDTFNLLQFNANGIGNKLSELELFLEKHCENGSNTGIQVTEPSHPELHNSTTRLTTRPKRRTTDLHSQVDQLPPTALVTRDSI